MVQKNNNQALFIAYNESIVKHRQDKTTNAEYNIDLSSNGVMHSIINPFRKWGANAPITM